jgi:hypothetical protein
MRNNVETRCLAPERQRHLALGGMVYSTEPHSGVVSTIRGSPLDAAVKNQTDEYAVFVQGTKSARR